MIPSEQSVYLRKIYIHEVKILLGKDSHGGTLQKLKRGSDGRFQTKTRTFSFFTKKQHEGTQS